MIPGFATFEGTSRYRSRFAQLADAGHFRQAEHVPGAGELWCPSIGLGTYLGEPDDKADREYVDAIAEALQSGINLLDTAINYRHQRSERNIGEALAKTTAAAILRRDEVVVCTKAGYLSLDGNLLPIRGSISSASMSSLASSIPETWPVAATAWRRAI